MKKIYIALVMMVSALCVFAGGQQEADGSIVMRCGDIEALENLGAVGMDRAADLANEKSGGTVTIQNFHASQLGSASKQLELVKSGALEAFRGGIGWLNQFEGGYAIFGYPYLFPSAEALVDVINGPVGEELQEKLIAEHGLRIINADWTRLQRHFLTKEPVRTLEDLKGMKIRVPESPSFMDSMTTLGASPTPIAFGEVYMALKQGVVDGCENHVESLYNMKFYEVAKNLTLSSHNIEATAVIVNNDWWLSLTSEQQDVITSSLSEAGDWYQAELEKKSDEYLQKLVDGGVTVWECDNKAWRDVVIPAAPLKTEATGLWEAGLVDKVLAALDN